MAQLTIYIDDETLGKISKSAKLDDDSVSAWVKKRLTGSMTDAWPKDYFKVFGSLRQADIARPKQPDAKKDCAREVL